MAEEVYNHKFTWDGGGNCVFLCGSFNNWKKIPMAKSREDPGVFKTSVNIPKGRYEYKFLVDGDWMLDSKMEKASNDQGYINNVCRIPPLDVAGSRVDFLPEQSYIVSPQPSPVVGDEDSDSESESDTESVNSTSSGINPIAGGIQKVGKLQVQCPQAPLIVKEHLKQHLELNGFADNVTRITWKTPRKAKGYSFVYLSQPHMVDDAILKLNGSMLLGQYKIQVKRYNRSRCGGRGRDPKKKQTGKTTKLFVRHFPKFIDEQQLKRHFQSFQKHISHVEMVKDKGTQQSKGCGFVVFTSRPPAEQAVLALDGTLLLNKHKIKVEFTKQDKKIPIETASSVRSTAEELHQHTKTGVTTKVFVGSLPKFINEQHLKEHFRSFQNYISRVEVLKDKETKQSKGCGFVVFSSRPPAEQAVLALDGTLLLSNHKIKVEFAKQDKKMPTESVSSTSEELHQHTKTGVTTKVFVGSLPKFINEQHLKEHFRSFQSYISRVEVLKDKETKQSKGCGFVVFSSRPLAERAVLELNGTLLLDKHRIKVEFAKVDKKTSVQSPTMAGPPSEEGFRNPYLPPLSGSQTSFDQDTSDTESVCSVSSTSGEFCHVYINSYPPLEDSVTEKHLRDHLSRFQADILKIKIVKDRKSNKCKGYAIATFSSKAIAEEVIESMNNSVLRRQFKLNLHCKSEQEQPSPTKIPKTRDMFGADRRETDTQFADISSSEPVYSASSISSPLSHVIKITCLPKTVTKEDLYQLLRPYGEVIGPLTIFESKNRYALANFSSLSDAQSAVANLNNFVMNGYTIKLSLKGNPKLSSSQRETSGTVDFQSQPPLLNVIAGSEDVSSRLPPVARAGMEFVITVDNLDPLIGISELQAMMVGIPIMKFERVASSTQIHFSSYETAQVAVGKLNGKSLLGKTIQAYMDKSAISPQVTQLNPVLGKDAFQYPVQSRIGPVPLYHQSQGIPPEPSLASERQVLKLSPEQWNRIMNVRPAGTSLFHEIIEPYKTNRSIEIKPEMDTLSIHFTGVREAVASAYKRLDNEVNKEIQVPDRWRKSSLVHLRPDLPGVYRQKYGIALTGYNEDSTTIGFEGNPQSLHAARQELQELLRSIYVAEVKIGVSEKLLHSARERFRLDGTKVCVYRKDPPPSGSVSVYSFVPFHLDRAVKILKEGLFTECVDVVSEEIADRILLSTPVHNSVDIRKCGLKIHVKGYMLHDVQTLTESLTMKVKEISVQKVPLDCTPEECAYINRLNKTDHPTKEMISSLPVQCVIKKNAIILNGSPESISQAKNVIREKLLAQLLSRRFTFQCNTKFVSQLEDFILKPAGSELVWIVDHTSPSNPPQQPHSRRRMSSGGEEKEISLIICSKSPGIFHQVCSSLEHVQPSSKKFQLPRGATESIKLSEIKPGLELRFHVRIVIGGRENFLVIHGLTSKEVNICWSEIDQKVRDTHKIAKHIPISRQQRQFLERKRSQELAKLKDDCDELHFLPPRNETESHSLRIKGTIQTVDTVSERVTEFINSLVTVEDHTECETKHARMWIKWWVQIKQQQERCSDISIEIDEARSAKRPSLHKGELPSTTSINFCLVGTDVSEIEAVRDMISQRNTVTKTLKLTANATSTLRKDKKEFLYPLAVHLFVNTHSNEAVLTAPQEANEDFETAEEEIMKFIGERTTTSKSITCDDEVVGLVLTSRIKSAPYIAIASTIARQHGVKVHPLRKPQIGLRVSGSAEAIKIVEPLINSQVLRPIAQTIDQLTIKVSNVYGSVFSTSNFMQFNSKLQDEFCVSCTFPRMTKSNKVVRHAMIQPSDVARCLKLEICKGSIIFEQADAIVNAANEHLEHIGGLAKAILDAGGPTIQTESDYYIREYGKLKPGQVVSLGPGRLPFRSIIHAVGPRWQGGAVSEESNLYLTVYKCLQTASESQYGSIALPAISTGIFSVPENICARVSLKAVQDFCQADPQSSLHTVRFVLYRQSELNEFCSYFDSDAVLKKPESQIPDASSSPTVSTNRGSGSWLWENDQCSFTPYSSEVSKKLSQTCLQNPRGSTQMSVHGNMYMVDFGSMTQTNMATYHKRNVKFDPSSTPQNTGSTQKRVQWYYTNDTRGFSQYQPSDSQSIEKMYQSKAPSYLQIGASTYTFDFSSMCQINCQTKYKRAIQRQESSLPLPAPNSGPGLGTPNMSHKETASVSHGKPQKNDLCVILRGPRDTLPLAKSKLEKKLQSCIQKESIPIPFALPPEFSKKLTGIALKHNVTLSIIEGVDKSSQAQKAQSVITLEGIYNDVQFVVKSVQQEIIDYQVSKSDSSDLEVAIPTEWQPQSSTTEVFLVVQGTAEWNQVERKFRATLGASQIATISRIQNSWLWDKYCSHKKRLSLKNSGRVNEMELFHGTRGNDPKLLYEGEDGFDMRYSNQGMWGQANYFAVNASYSNAYSYRTSDGRFKEMFLVKVLTGDSFKCGSNGSLRMPPVKAATAGYAGATSGKVQLAQMRYDTVTGETGGSQVFMTYDNDKAYPAYLIKYN